MNWDISTFVTDGVTVIQTTGIHSGNSFEGTVIKSEWCEDVPGFVGHFSNNWNKSKFHSMTTINQNKLGKLEIDTANIPGSTEKVVEVTQTQQIIGINSEVPVRQYIEFAALPGVIEQLQRIYDENKPIKVVEAFGFKFEQ